MSKQDNHNYFYSTISELNKQIEAHERIIEGLRIAKQLWTEKKEAELNIIPTNQPLTRELIRKVLKGANRPVQTVELIDLLYSGKTVTERYNLIKHLSVIFNQMKDELMIEKKKGVKGSFYSLIDK